MRKVNKTAVRNFLTKQIPKVASEGSGAFKKASTQIANERFKICLNCDESFFTSGGRLRCNDCGCYLKEKTSLATQICNLGYW